MDGTETRVPDRVFQQLLSLSNPSHQLDSGFSNYLLYEAEGLRWLCSPPGAVQCAMCLESPERLVLPNQHAMLLAALLPDSRRRVLDLGTGGAGFLRALGATDGHSEFTCVELDPDMLAVARHAFRLPHEQMVHLEDALTFLARDRGYYDLVFCDLFRGRTAPAAMLTDDFFESLATRLEQSGVVAMNTLPQSEEELLELLRLARRHFPGVALLGFENLGNVVLLLGRETLPSQTVWRDRLATSPWGDDDFLAACLDQLIYG